MIFASSCDIRSMTMASPALQRVADRAPTGAHSIALFDCFSAVFDVFFGGNLPTVYGMVSRLARNRMMIMG